VFESQTRIRIARTAHTAVGALSSQFAANLECGVRLQRDLGYPETYPKKVVAAGGCPRTSLEHRRARKWLRKPNLQRFVGCLWTLLDVYGRPRMAPRAGFEVERKSLSGGIVPLLDQQNTPGRTPLSSKLIHDLKRQRRRVFACCRLTPALWSSAPGFGNWLVG
jgi:hypothetical protein